MRASASPHRNHPICTPFPGSPQQPAPRGFFAEMALDAIARTAPPKPERQISFKFTPVGAHDHLPALIS